VRGECQLISGLHTGLDELGALGLLGHPGLAALIVEDQEGVHKGLRGHAALILRHPWDNELEELRHTALDFTHRYPRSSTMIGQ